MSTMLRSAARHRTTGRTARLTPAARIAAAVELLEAVLASPPLLAGGVLGEGASPWTQRPPPPPPPPPRGGGEVAGGRRMRWPTTISVPAGSSVLGIGAPYR